MNFHSTTGNLPRRFRLSPRNTCNHRRGALLLIVMACIIIAGIAMVGITRQSLRVATDSIQAERALQNRWGVISTQRTLLKAAPQMFIDLEKQSRIAGNTGPHPSSVRSQLLLGGVKFEVLLADEQAKLNLNTSFHRRGKNEAERVARLFQGTSGLRLHMTPEVRSAGLGSSRKAGNDSEEEDNEAPPAPPAFRHWGQVFDLAHAHAPGSMTEPSGDWRLPTATQRLTCWGRGEVNIARASDRVIAETCRTLLGPGVARRLVQEYRENPDRSIQQTALVMEMDEKDLLSLGQLLTKKSSSFSLWLSVKSAHGSQQWFAVSSQRNEIGTVTERFRFK